MSKDPSYKNCPFKLLLTCQAKMAPHPMKLLDLDQRVRLYFEAPQAQRTSIRHELFFGLSPFLRKLLGWYCRLSSGCGVNCEVRDLLSTSYLVFARLLDKFDFDRHLNFLGYVVRGLSWGVFNSYMKERRYKERVIPIFSQMQREIKVGGQEGNGEGQWLSAVELDRVLRRFRPAVRDLLLLHYVFGYSYVDLSQLVDRHPKTIQKTIERACKRMAAVYKKAEAYSVQRKPASDSVRF